MGHVEPRFTKLIAKQFRQGRDRPLIVDCMHWLWLVAPSPDRDPVASRERFFPGSSQEDERDRGHPHHSAISEAPVLCTSLAIHL